MSSGFEWHQVLLREGGGSQGAGTAPRASPDTPGPQTLGGTKPRDHSYAHLASCSLRRFGPGGPPSRAQASSLPTEAPACPSPTPQPCSPNPGRPQPHGHQPPALPACHPQTGRPQPTSLIPPAWHPGQLRDPPTAPETAQSSQRPAVPPTCLSHGNPSKALPSPSCCVPDCLSPPPPSPGSSCGPQATSWRRHCPPGAVSWKGHGGEGGQRCPQVPEEYEETHAWIWSLEAPPHSTRLTHRGVAPHPQASQVRPESPSPEAHSQRGPPPGALLRREDTRPASQTAGALASPSDLFHLGLSRQMDRVLWGWALRTRNASADQYSISWANLCLQSDCLSSTSSNITALLSAFKASEELASHRRTNLVFYFISHQFTKQVGGPHPCQFPH